MLATIESATVIGVDACRVHVEIDVSRGFPTFQLVGLPDASIKESRDRIRSAIRNSGLKFPLGQPGQARHSVHAERWRPRRPAGEGRPLLQPVCATPLDRAVERYALPLPNHLRIGNLSSVNSIIAGAATTLTGASVRTVFVTMSEKDRAEASGRLASHGFREAGAKVLKRERVHALFARPA